MLLNHNMGGDKPLNKHCKKKEKCNDPSQPYLNLTEHEPHNKLEFPLQSNNEVHKSNNEVKKVFFNPSFFNSSSSKKLLDKCQSCNKLLTLRKPTKESEDFPYCKKCIAYLISDKERYDFRKSSDNSVKNNVAIDSLKTDKLIIQTNSAHIHESKSQSDNVPLHSLSSSNIHGSNTKRKHDEDDSSKKKICSDTVGNKNTEEKTLAKGSSLGYTKELRILNFPFYKINPKGYDMSTKSKLQKKNLEKSSIKSQPRALIITTRQQKQKNSGEGTSNNFTTSGNICKVDSLVDNERSEYNSNLVTIDSLMNSLPGPDCGILLSQVKNDTLFECAKCGKQLRGSKVASDHYVSCRYSKPNKNLVSFCDVRWVCNFCHSIFNQMSQLSRHMEVERKTKTLITKSPSSKIATLKDSAIICPNCKYKCWNLSIFKDHNCEKNLKHCSVLLEKLPPMDNCSDLFLYYLCPFKNCRKVFFGENSLLEHQRDQHNREIVIRPLALNIDKSVLTIVVKSEIISPENDCSERFATLPHRKVTENRSRVRALEQQKGYSDFLSKFGLPSNFIRIKSEHTEHSSTTNAKVHTSESNVERFFHSLQTKLTSNDVLTPPPTPESVSNEAHSPNREVVAPDRSNSRLLQKPQVAEVLNTHQNNTGNVESIFPCISDFTNPEQNIPDSDQPIDKNQASDRPVLPLIGNTCASDVNILQEQLNEASLCAEKVFSVLKDKTSAGTSMQSQLLPLPTYINNSYSIDDAIIVEKVSSEIDIQPATSNFPNIIHSWDLNENISSVDAFVSLPSRHITNNPQYICSECFLNFDMRSFLNHLHSNHGRNHKDIFVLCMEKTITASND